MNKSKCNISTVPDPWLEFNPWKPIMEYKEDKLEEGALLIHPLEWRRPKYIKHMQCVNIALKMSLKILWFHFFLFSMRYWVVSMKNTPSRWILPKLDISYKFVLCILLLNIEQFINVSPFDKANVWKILQMLVIPVYFHYVLLSRWDINPYL